MVVLNKFKAYALSIYRKGISICEFSTYLTIAIVATTFPVFGFTTIVVTAIGIRFKYNLPLLILLTYALEPLRFFAFTPLTQAGSYLLNSSSEGLSLESVNNVFNMGIIESISYVFNQLFFAIFGWLIIIIPASFLFFYISKSILNISVAVEKKCV